MHLAQLPRPLTPIFALTKTTCIFTAEISFWLRITLATLTDLHCHFISTPVPYASHASFSTLAQDNPFAIDIKPSNSPHHTNSTTSSAHLMAPSSHLRPPMDLLPGHSLHCPALAVSLFQLSWVLKGTILGHHCLLFLDMTFPDTKILFPRGTFPIGPDAALKIHSPAATGTRHARGPHCHRHFELPVVQVPARSYHLVPLPFLTGTGRAATDHYS